MQALKKTADLFEREDEASAYLDRERVGYFSLLVNHDGRKIQKSHRLTDMPTVLRLVDKKRDSWLSQAEFIVPNRRVVNLARIGLLFCDLDTYNVPALAGKSAGQLTDAVLFFCEQEGIPEPSILVYSGRGIQAKWLLDKPLPRDALPRWNACQKHLVEKLGYLGADPQARDASRVLRLIDTVNTKSGQVCEVTHVRKDENRKPVKYEFEYLCEWLLPFSREQLQAKRQEREEKKAAFTLVHGSAPKTGLRGFSGRELAWHRLEDLRTLASLRGGVEQGQRMNHLFWQMNFLLLSGATHSSLMYAEAAELARKIDPSWKYHDSELSTLYSKAKAHNAGETVEWNGRKVSGLYTPKNDTLISRFRITDAEQKHLRTIISASEAKARDAARKQAYRQKHGAVSRDTYLSAAQQRKQQAMQLRQQGKTWAEIAQAVGFKNAEAARRSIH